MKYISVKEFQKGVPRILYMEDAFPIMVQRRGVDIALLIKPDTYGKRNLKGHLPSKGGDSEEKVASDGEEVSEVREEAV